MNNEVAEPALNSDVSSIIPHRGLVIEIGEIGEVLRLIFRSPSRATPAVAGSFKLCNKVASSIAMFLNGFEARLCA